MWQGEISKSCHQVSRFYVLISPLRLVVTPPWNSPLSLRVKFNFSVAQQASMEDATSPVPVKLQVGQDKSNPPSDNWSQSAYVCLDTRYFVPVEHGRHFTLRPSPASGHFPPSKYFQLLCDSAGQFEVSGIVWANAFNVPLEWCFWINQPPP